MTIARGEEKVEEEIDEADDDDDDVVEVPVKIACSEASDYIAYILYCILQIYALQTDNAELLENMCRGEAIIESDRLRVIESDPNLKTEVH